jgi:hypothetical protein
MGMGRALIAQAIFMTNTREREDKLYCITRAFGFYALNANNKDVSLVV